MGWEPDEVHVHYDAAGVETGRTVVTREPEWDDEQRELALEHQSYLRQVHPDCGNHVSEAMDQSVVRWVEHAPAVCEDCRAIKLERERWHQEQGHDKKGPCPCDDEEFWVDKRTPMPAKASTSVPGTHR